MFRYETAGAGEGTGRAVEAPEDSSIGRSLWAVCAPFGIEAPASFPPEKLIEILVTFGKPGLHRHVLQMEVSVASD